MEGNEEVQEFYRLSLEYLNAAEENLNSDLTEPAMFNGIHALELSLKAALLEETGENYKTHNIGGVFGKHFRHQIGKAKCKQVNKILMKYNFPRYPNQPKAPRKEVEEDINFIKELMEELKAIIK